jgi:CcmD family protein
MFYLFSAFLILWAITFGYVFSLHTRQKRLQRELEQALSHPQHDTSRRQDTP